MFFATLFLLILVQFSLALDCEENKTESIVASGQVIGRWYGLLSWDTISGQPTVSTCYQFDIRPATKEDYLDKCKNASAKNFANHIEFQMSPMDSFFANVDGVYYSSIDCEAFKQVEFRKFSDSVVISYLNVGGNGFLLSENIKSREELECLATNVDVIKASKHASLICWK